MGEWFLVPVASASLQPQLAVADQITDAIVEFLVVPPANIVVRQRQFVGRTCEMRAEDVGVRGIDHRWLRLSLEDLVGVTHQVAVELVVAGNEYRDARRVASPGAPRLLPHGRNRAGEPVDHAGIKVTDVDAEFERRGRDDAAQRAVAHLLLDRPTFLGEVAGPIRHHRAFQVRRYPAGDVGGDEFGAFSALAEGDRSVTGLDQRSADRGHLAVGRGAHAGLLIDDRWVEQCEPT